MNNNVLSGPHHIWVGSIWIKWRLTTLYSEFRTLVISQQVRQVSSSSFHRWENQDVFSNYWASTISRPGLGSETSNTNETQPYPAEIHSLMKRQTWKCWTIEYQDKQWGRKCTRNSEEEVISFIWEGWKASQWSWHLWLGSWRLCRSFSGVEGHFWGMCAEPWRPRRKRLAAHSIVASSIQWTVQNEAWEVDRASVALPCGALWVQYTKAKKKNKQKKN